MSDAAADPVTLYAFEQLEPPRPVALREVEDPLEAARAEAEQIREQARAEGFAAGQAAALAAAQPGLDAAVAALQAAVAGVEQVREETAAKVERDAIELALQLAEKIVAGALAVESERIVDVVRGALRRLAERRRVTILVNPDDLETVREATDSFVTGLGGIEHCEVQAERRIAPGGALVRTEEGQIDATVATQLMRARELVELELGE
ncbi:FliH/SctL family protein [Conexibacter arvalis]|uniref:Flagellar assembly protein FliH n=1 Tax=Conexibacter arvalis TaxID=912552 RepID=A0A840IAA8_9ACTN|nr:FliH/SctL family protein [Conexibacter arvalis]MBB4661008.1 flagellar assembly protein FliH [Conexibacter arvalis]